MKAIRFHRYGEPADILTVTDKPVPQPGARQVRLKSGSPPSTPPTCSTYGATTQG